MPFRKYMIQVVKLHKKVKINIRYYEDPTQLYGYRIKTKTSITLQVYLTKVVVVLMQ